MEPAFLLNNVANFFFVKFVKNLKCPSKKITNIFATNFRKM